MALAKRRRAKRTRVQAGGALTVEEAPILIAQKGTGRQQSNGRPAEGDASDAGPRLRGAAGGAARLGTMYEPVTRLKRRQIRRVALSAIDFLMLWLCN